MQSCPESRSNFTPAESNSTAWSNLCIQKNAIGPGNMLCGAIMPKKCHRPFCGVLDFHLAQQKTMRVQNWFNPTRTYTAHSPVIKGHSGMRSNLQQLTNKSIAGNLREYGGIICRNMMAKTCGLDIFAAYFNTTHKHFRLTSWSPILGRHLRKLCIWSKLSLHTSILVFRLSHFQSSMVQRLLEILNVVIRTQRCCSMGCCSKSMVLLEVLFYLF